MHKKQLFVIETLKGMLQYWKDLGEGGNKVLTVMKLEILLVLWIFYMRLSTRQKVTKLEVNVCIF